MVRRWELLAILQLTLVAADVQVYSDGEPFMLVADFLLAEANFGDKIPLGGIHAMATLANPPNACLPIQPPPTDIPNPPERWAVLIRRYNCTFEQKIINAQNAFYDIAIVHNVDSNKLEIMNVSDPDKISIISVFITANAGREIANKYLYDKGYYLLLDRNGSNDFLSKILLPFVVIVSVSFILMSGFMVAKCIKDYRRARRHRMPYTSLNKIPIAKYRKSDPFETCAICLDDFIEGEKLRILPCSHAYHIKCIDPWLTRSKRVCPLCKRKVFAADERRMESDLSSSDEDDDNQPLLRGRIERRNTYGGTNNSESVTIRSTLSPETAEALMAAVQRSRLRIIADLERMNRERSSWSSGSSPSSSDSDGSAAFENSNTSNTLYAAALSYDEESGSHHGHANPEHADHDHADHDHADYGHAEPEHADPEHAAHEESTDTVTVNDPGCVIS